MLQLLPKIADDDAEILDPWFLLTSPGSGKYALMCHDPTDMSGEHGKYVMFLAREVKFLCSSEYDPSIQIDADIAALHNLLCCFR